LLFTINKPDKAAVGCLRFTSRRDDSVCHAHARDVCWPHVDKSSLFVHRPCGRGSKRSRQLQVRTGCCWRWPCLATRHRWKLPTRSTSYTS